MCIGCTYLIVSSSILSNGMNTMMMMMLIVNHSVFNYGGFLYDCTFVLLNAQVFNFDQESLNFI